MLGQGHHVEPLGIARAVAEDHVRGLQRADVIVRRAPERGIHVGRREKGDLQVLARDALREVQQRVVDGIDATPAPLGRRAWIVGAAGDQARSEQESQEMEVAHGGLLEGQVRAMIVSRSSAPQR